MVEFDVETWAARKREFQVAAHTQAGPGMTARLDIPLDDEFTVSRAMDELEALAKNVKRQISFAPKETEKDLNVLMMTLRSTIRDSRAMLKLLAQKK